MTHPAGESTAGAPPAAPHSARASTAELLPLVYQELRRLAAFRLANEYGGEPIDPTSLVHAAYLRILGSAAEDATSWTGRGHLFGAASLAMRRILVERARERRQLKDGGGWRRIALVDLPGSTCGPVLDVLALDDALVALEQLDEQKYRVVMLRYFAGLGIEDTGEMLGLSPASVKRHWTFARLWLADRMGCADVHDRTSPDA